MTGNKNAWRAPLAGLASLAMLATMGVAAGTAAAASAPELTVKFDVNGGTTSSTIADKKADISNSYKVGVPGAIPSRDGYEFTGWYTAAEVGQGERFDFAGSHFGDGTVTLYAHYAKQADTQKVTFSKTKPAGNLGDNDQNGVADTKTTTITVAKADAKLASWQKPTDAGVDGQIVTGGWKLNSASGADYKAGDALPSTATVTLIPTVQAGHIVKLATDTAAPALKDDATKNVLASGLVAPNADTNWSIEVADGASLPDGVNGYVASGADKYEVVDWAVKANDGSYSLYNGDAIEANTTLFAVKPNIDDNNKVAKVTFAASITGYPSTPDPVYVRVGTPVTLPTVDTAGDYYYVAGWKNGTEDFEDGDSVTADTTLTFDLEKTAIAEHTVTFDPNYTGSTATKVTVKDGEYVDTPAEPTRDGYVFIGWFNASISPKGEPKKQLLKDAHYDVSSSPVTGDVTYFAGWLKDTKVADLVKVNKLNNSNVDKAAFTAASVKAFKTAYTQAKNKANLTVKEDKAFAADASLYDVAQFTDEAKAESLTKDLQAAQAKLVAKNQDSVYRVYDVNGSHKHLYTTNAAEAANLVAAGWRNEGVAFKTAGNISALDVEVESGLYEPVFRLYDQPAKRHLYTTDQAEYDNLVNNLGWRDEGVAFYARTQGGEAVYRAYSPSRYEHLFTTNQTEYNNATNAKGEGWYRAEGIKFNVE